RGGQTDKLAELLKSQAACAEALAHSNPSASNSSQYRRSYRRYGYPMNPYYSGEQQGNETFQPNWHEALKQAYVQYRLLEPLSDYGKKLGSRLSAAEWSGISEVFAALGKSDDARKLRANAVEAAVARLRAMDEPKVESQEDRYSWMWQWYGGGAAQE